jgi:hypothetical protein
LLGKITFRIAECGRHSARLRISDAAFSPELASMSTHLHSSRQDHLQWRVRFLRNALCAHRATTHADAASWKMMEADLVTRIEIAETEITLYPVIAEAVSPA